VKAETLLEIFSHSPPWMRKTIEAEMEPFYRRCVMNGSVDIESDMMKIRRLQRLVVMKFFGNEIEFTPINLNLKESFASYQYLQLIRLIKLLKQHARH
jgi:hypothetical protein